MSPARVYLQRWDQWEPTPQGLADRQVSSPLERGPASFWEGHSHCPRPWVGVGWGASHSATGQTPWHLSTIGDGQRGLGELW